MGSRSILRGVGILGVILAALAGCSGDGGTVPDPVCTGAMDRPTARGEMAGAYVPDRAQVVFFGGDTGVTMGCIPQPEQTAELWLYTPGCGEFERVDTVGPSARTRAVAAYAEGFDSVYLFGGRFRAAPSGTYTVYNELWRLDINSLEWEDLGADPAGPGVRANTVAVFRSRGDEIVIFGGNASNDGAIFLPLGDVWAFDVKNGTWREIVAPGGPRARLFHAAAYDHRSDRLFVYGGGDEGAFFGPFFRDLWALDLGKETWELLDLGTGVAPFGRIEPTLIYDDERRRLVLFGGHDDQQLGNTNDSWAFDLSEDRWVALGAPDQVNAPSNGFCSFPGDFTEPNFLAPERRSGQVGVATAHDSLAVIGGKTDCGVADDAWVLDLETSTWAREVEATAGETCARRMGSANCVDLCQTPVP